MDAEEDKGVLLTEVGGMKAYRDRGCRRGYEVMSHVIPGMCRLT